MQPKAAKLCKALREAYVSRDELRVMLDEELDIRLDDIDGSTTLRVTIHNVVAAVISMGRWDEFIGAVRADKPDSPELRKWFKEFLAAPAAGPAGDTGQGPSAQQLLDSVHFDLSEIRRAIREAMAAQPGRVVGFGVTYPEWVFVRKLCEWLARYLAGETQRKDVLNLKPEVAPVDRRVRQVQGYRPDLESVNVLCQVLVEAVPANCIADFWDQVRGLFDESGHYLVLVFVGDHDTSFPPEVKVLPRPRFLRDDVAHWAEDVVGMRGWPQDMALAWTEWLCARAPGGDDLDVPTLYEAMDWSIGQIRLEPDQFREVLESRARLCDRGIRSTRHCGSARRKRSRR